MATPTYLAFLTESFEYFRSEVGQLSIDLQQPHRYQQRLAADIAALVQHIRLFDVLVVFTFAILLTVARHLTTTKIIAVRLYILFRFTANLSKQSFCALPRKSPNGVAYRPRTARRFPKVRGSFSSTSSRGARLRIICLCTTPTTISPIPSKCGKVGVMRSSLRGRYSLTASFPVHPRQITPWRMLSSPTSIGCM